MQFYTFNKIAGAILGTAMAVLAIYIVSEEIYSTEAPEGEHAGVAETAAHPPAGAPEVAAPPPGQMAAAVIPPPPAVTPAPPVEPPPGQVAQVTPPPAEPPAAGPTVSGDAFVALVAAGDVAAGEATARRCIACHTFGAGEAARVGPNLHDVVGRAVGGVEGFNYSEAFAALHAAGDVWTVAALGDFLFDPRVHVPGTRMGFAGLKDDTERANVVAYLRSLSDNPVALPGAGAAPAPAPAPAAPPPSAMAPAPPAMAPAPPPSAMAPIPPSAMAPIPPPAAAPAPAAPPAQVAQAPAAAPAPAAGAAPAGGNAELIAALAAADATAGEAISRRCIACHSFDDGGANRVGPNLYGVIGRVIGTHPDYAYSPAVAALGATGATWTFEQIDAFLTNPRGAVPGTKMGFAGLPNADERHNLIAYLRTLSATPVPLQ